MRDYTGIVVADLEDPRVRSKLAQIDYYLRDLTKGIARIQQGQVPDGSGTTIIDSGPLSDIYLVLLGRPGNQVAHGGTSPGGTLTLSSTTHTTRGSVYLGEAKQSAYDEVNERLGVNQPTPTAKVHIKVGELGQTSPPTVAGGGADWQNIGGAGSFVAALTDGNDATYAQGDIGAPGTAFQGSFTAGMTDPGTRTGFTIKVRCQSIAGGSNANMVLQFTNNSGGGYWTQFAIRCVNDTANSGDEFQATGAFTTFTHTCTSSDLNGGSPGGATINFSSQPWIYNIQFSGTPVGNGVFNIAQIEVDIPGTASDALQKWEATSTSNTLNLVADGLGNKAMAFQGGRMVVSATAFALSSGAGSPASGMVAASQDAIGTFLWASASGLATIETHDWAANGPYRVGDEVDSAWIPSKNMSLVGVRLYRRVGGTSGSTQVTLTRNGTTMLSTDPIIAFNAGASATASGVVSVTAISAGDRIAASAISADVGLPRDAAWRLAVRAY